MLKDSIKRKFFRFKQVPSTFGMSVKRGMGENWDTARVTRGNGGIG